MGKQPGVKGMGRGMECSGLCSRETQGAEFSFGAGKNHIRQETLEMGREAAPDRFSSLQRDELVRDDPQQALEPWLGMSQRWHAMAADHESEAGLCVHQPCHRFFEIMPIFQLPHLPCLTFWRNARKSIGMSRPIFRFAPSPNGLLHLGHAYSALLNARMAEDSGGRLLLRIEDTDQSRCRPEFAAAILADLRWLGLHWEEPVRIQSQHFEDYDANLAKLWNMKAIYPCFCSRKQALANGLASSDPDGQPHYGGACRSLTRADAERRLSKGTIHGWRVDMRMIGDAAAAVWGDAVIAKRRVGSSYHIAVVTDDAIQGVTHVVRGRDIEAATPLHMLLQRLLGLPTPHYVHHDLILDETGHKLSKSLRSTALRDLREDGVTAQDIRMRLGFG